MLVDKVKDKDKAGKTVKAAADKVAAALIVLLVKVIKADKIALLDKAEDKDKIVLLELVIKADKIVLLVELELDKAAVASIVLLELVIKADKIVLLELATKAIAQVIKADKIALQPITLDKILDQKKFLKKILTIKSKQPWLVWAVEERTNVKKCVAENVIICVKSKIKFAKQERTANCN